jgi:sugar lactone lactonase YvrE
VVDSKGNLYIADSNNHVIRKVDGSTGIITTIAGNGKPGYGGDGGQASGALLDYPQGMALDSEGNLYFADSGNYLIRKINLSSGIISIAAGTYGNYGWSGDGGPATEAGVVYPTAVAFDGAGNFYIAEYDGRIRKVTKAGGIISTIAGNGDWGNDGDGGKATEAEVAPYGIAVDTAGDIYITSLPGAIRVISKSTGLISTVAGTGFYGYSGDGGSAAVAEFGDPSEIAFDAAGNLYIADYYNSRVRMVGPPPPTATPEFKPAAGTYSKTQSVTISDGTPGATIYYTTNGKAPTTSSTQYSGAITVSATETIKAMAAAPDHANSAIMTGNYTISTSSKASTAAASQLNAPGTGTR